MRNLLILAAILLIASGATAQETARLFTATTFSATDSPSGEPRKPKAQPPQSAQQKAQAGEEALPATAPAAGQTAGTGGTDKRGERNKRDGRFIQSYKVMLFKKPEGKEQTRRVLWRDGRWAGVGIHYNGLVTNLGNFSLPDDAKYLSQSSKSIGVTINPIDFILLGNRKIHLMTGLGFELNNFRFDQDIALKYEKGVTVPDYQYIEQGIKLSKSKLFTAYMNIPLLVEFQTGRNHNFFINAGLVGGLRIGAHTKIKGDGPLVGGTAKDHSSFGLRNFHYGYTLNFGYSNIGFNVTYYHSPLWREGAGPQVRQINVGISLVLSIPLPPRHRSG